MDDARLPLPFGVEDRDGETTRGGRDKEEIKAITRALNEIAKELHAINKTLNVIKARVKV